MYSSLFLPLHFVSPRDDETHLAASSKLEPSLLFLPLRLFFSREDGPYLKASSKLEPQVRVALGVRF